MWGIIKEGRMDGCEDRCGMWGVLGCGDLYIESLVL